MTFLLCDPGWYVHLMSRMDGKKTHTHTHTHCSADHEQDWQPYPADPYSAICDDHKFPLITSNKYSGSTIVLWYYRTDCTSSLRCNTVQVTGFAYGLILMALVRPTVSSDMMLLAHRVSSKHPPAVDAIHCTLGVDEQASFLRGPWPKLSVNVRVLVQFSSLECTKYRSTTNY